MTIEALDLAMLFGVGELGGFVDMGELGACADPDDPDEWLKALDILGMIRGEGAGPGKVEVECPWEGSHTLREQTGTAYLGDGRFKCQHGHCVSRKSSEFQEEIDRRLRDESCGLVSMAGLVFGDDDLPELVEPSGPVELFSSWAEAAESLIWIEDQAKYLDIETRGLLGPAQVEARCSRLVLPGTGGTKAALKVLFNVEGFRRAKSLTFWPGGGLLVHGQANTWRPSSVRSSSGSVFLDKILGHLELLVPEADARGVLVFWMAHNVQKPGVKINWCPLIQGDPGVGKDLMLQAFRNVVGQHNCRDVSVDELDSPFNGWLETQIVILAELAAADRFHVFPRIKGWMTSPPAEVVINQKYMRPYPVPKNQNWIGFTNHEGAIAIDPGDRRFFVYVTKMKVQSADYYAELAEAAEQGAGEFLGWLRRVDLDGLGFSTGKCPETAGSALAKANMTRTAQSAAVQEIIEIIQDTTFGHRKLLSSTEISQACRHVHGSSPRAISDALRICGAEQWQQGQQVRTSTGRCRIWIMEPASGLHQQMDITRIKNALLKENPSKVAFVTA